MKVKNIVIGLLLAALASTSKAASHENDIPPPSRLRSNIRVEVLPSAAKELDPQEKTDREQYIKLALSQKTGATLSLSDTRLLIGLTQIYSSIADDCRQEVEAQFNAWKMHQGTPTQQKEEPDQKEEESRRQAEEYKIELTHFLYISYIQNGALHYDELEYLKFLKSELTSTAVEECEKEAQTKFNEQKALQDQAHREAEALEQEIKKRKEARQKQEEEERARLLQEQEAERKEMERQRREMERQRQELQQRQEQRWQEAGQAWINQQRYGWQAPAQEAWQGWPGHGWSAPSQDWQKEEEPSGGASKAGRGEAKPRWGAQQRTDRPRTAAETDRPRTSAEEAYRRQAEEECRKAEEKYHYQAAAAARQMEEEDRLKAEAEENRLKTDMEKQLNDAIAAQTSQYTDPEEKKKYRDQQKALRQEAAKEDAALKEENNPYTLQIIGHQKDFGTLGKFLKPIQIDGKEYKFIVLHPSTMLKVTNPYRRVLSTGLTYFRCPEEGLSTFQGKKEVVENKTKTYVNSVLTNLFSSYKIKATWENTVFGKHVW